MKKKLIFVAGCEGMGHHMFKDIFYRGAVVADQYINELDKYWDSVDENRDKFFEKTVLKLVNSNNNLFIYSPSCPYNQPRDAIRRPDLYDFKVKAHKYIDVRYLILYRSPKLAAYSNYRRDMENNIYHSAKRIEDNLIYIKHQLENHFNKDEWKTIRYETITAQPQNYIEAIPEYLKISDPESKKILQNNLVKNVKSGNKEIPDKEKNLLDSFFTNKRLETLEKFYLDNELIKKINPLNKRITGY